MEEKKEPVQKKTESEIEKIKVGVDLASEILSIAEHVTKLMEKKNKTPEDVQRLQQWQAYIKLGKHLAAMVGDAAAVAEYKANESKKDKVEVE